MEKLTAKQQAILNFIKQGIREKGYPPSVREMCLAVNLKSTSTVHSHLSTLQKKGYIKRDPAKPRAIEILDEDIKWLDQNATPVPILGRVTAGNPILAVENIETYLPLPNHMARHKEVYVLKVVGESMIKAGILNGDQIIVNRQTTASNGEIVVALLGEEVTVKRFFKEDGKIRLQPENDSMEPIYGKDIQVIGKVIGLFREF